jgi:spore protease
MFEKRTDLALERLEDLSGQTLPGVESRQWRQSPLSIHRITVTDSRGEQAIGRPRGQYLTAQMEPEALSDSQWIFRSATVLAQLLRPMLPAKGTVLVAGLGNRALTPDALGPMTLEHLMVTRHLIDIMPGEFGHLRPVCALAAGVLGSTGMETVEILRGAAQRVEPSAIIAVDAMASRSLERLCRTFQLSDTGIAPGSGACNPRQELNAHTMGVPVIALGVPTVVEARTLAMELVPDGQLDEKSTPDAGMLVSPKDIDLQVAKCAKVLGYALNLALQGHMTAAEMEQYLC